MCADVIKSIDFHVNKIKPKQYRPLEIFLQCEFNNITYNYIRHNEDNVVKLKNYDKNLTNIQNYERNYIYGIIHILQNIESTKRTITIYINNIYTKTLIKEFLFINNINQQNKNKDLLLTLAELYKNIKFDILLKHKF